MLENLNGVQPDWTASIIRRLSITNGHFSAMYLIECLNHDIEQQNLMRDGKIDHMLVFPVSKIG